MLLKCTAHFKSVFCAHKTNMTSIYVAVLWYLIFQEQWGMLNYSRHSITSQKNRISSTLTQLKPQTPHNTGTASQTAKWAACFVSVNPPCGSHDVKQHYVGLCLSAQLSGFPSCLPHLASTDSMFLLY